MSLDLIVNEVRSSWEHWICLTGGEPLIQHDAHEALEAFTQLGKSVLVETNGSVYIKNFLLKNTIFDVDVKTPSSGEENSFDLRNLDVMRQDDYLKFVIADLQDYLFAKEFLKKNSFNGTVIFQPAFGIDFKWIPEKILNDHLHVRFLLQLHKQIWGNIRRR